MRRSKLHVILVSLILALTAAGLVSAGGYAPLEDASLQSVGQLVEEYYTAFGDQRGAERLYTHLCTKITKNLPRRVFVESWVAIGRDLPKENVSQLHAYTDPSHMRAWAEYVVSWTRADTEGQRKAVMYFVQEDGAWRIANICRGMPHWWPAEKSPDQAAVLASAYRFLEGWQRRDFPSIYAQLPTAVRARHKAEEFQAFWEQRFYPVEVIDVMMPEIDGSTGTVTVMAVAMRRGWTEPMLLTLPLWACRKDAQWRVSCERLSQQDCGW